MSFLQDDKEQNDPNAPPGLQAPVVAGTTTREQFAAPTGASTGPTDSGTASSAAAAPTAGPTAGPGSAAPSSTPGNAQAAGKPPSWTNLMTFLGAQSDDEKASVVHKATTDASRNVAATNQAAGSAAAGINSDVAAGVNTGSVSTTKADGGVYTPPSYDLSKVNLSGYAGPTDAGARFGQTTANAAKAGNHAAALASGQVQQNSFDNALATQTPNWGKVLGAVGAENQAVQNSSAQQAGAQERINQATGQSDANVTKQKADLTAAGTALGANATATQKALQGYTAGLSSQDPTTLSDTLTKLIADPSAAAALGTSPAALEQLRQGLQYNYLTAQNVHDALQNGGYADASKNASGYSKDSADQQNQIGKLLANGQAAATTTAGGTGSLDLSGQGVQNQATIRGLSKAKADYEAATGRSPPGVLENLPVVGPIAGLFGSGPDRAQADAARTARGQEQSAVQALLAQGYSPDQIAQFSGLSPADIAALSK